jgi:hypothetical protein
MNRLLAIAIAVIAGGAIWRRHEIRNDAGRASKAISDATASTRSRIRSVRGPNDDAAGDVEDGAEAETDGAEGAADTGDEPADAAQEPADAAQEPDSGEGPADTETMASSS